VRRASRLCRSLPKIPVMVDGGNGWTALVTPFTDDGGSLSEVRLARVVRHVVSRGTSGLVVCSDTGEFATLSPGERKAVLEIVLRESQASLPVIAHVSSLGTATCIDLAQHAARHGARAAVMMPPYYGQWTPAEVEGHIRSVATYANLPLIVVDPLLVLTAASREALSTLPRLAIAGAGSRSDRFEWQGHRISPECGIFPADSSILQFLERLNPAGAIKTALHLQGVDAGPTRPPVRGLASEDERLLARLLPDAA
jgi:dihydrodipicolinate synthase/N-acetylneuraminate lyase